MSGERLIGNEFGLDDLAEDSEEEINRKKPDDEESLIADVGRMNGQARLSGSGRVRSGVEREVMKPSKGAGRGS
jgi:hypothetical protein